MKLPSTYALYAYWSQQCGARRAPDRHDLDPAGMRGVLPYTFMLEIDPMTRDYPIRLSGTRLDALFGHDMKGRCFADLWPTADRQALRALLADVVDDARPAVAGLQAAPAGYDRTSFELLLLPLRHNGRTHARLLCSLVPTVTPAWLGLQPVRTLSLLSWRLIDRALEPPATHTQAGGLRHHHLVVFEGGRAAKPVPLPAPQSRVKTPVSASRRMSLSPHNP